ncbi:MAG: type II toxin-antitoxin system VapC family toxin [Chitinophagales bacterium]
MSGRYLLDTNIVSAFFKNEKDVVKKISKASRIIIPVIVIGELYYGTFQSSNPAMYLLKIRELEKYTFVLDCDRETGVVYGEIKTALKKVSKQIPDNDIWIAALAKQHNLTLVTRDKHLTFVEDIDLEKW